METRQFIKTLRKQKVKTFFLSTLIALKPKWVPRFKGIRHPDLFYFYENTAAVMYYYFFSQSFILKNYSQSFILYWYTFMKIRVRTAKIGAKIILSFDIYFVKSQLSLLKENLSVKTISFHLKTLKF